MAPKCECDVQLPCESLTGQPPPPPQVATCLYHNTYMSSLFLPDLNRQLKRRPNHDVNLEDITLSRATVHRKRFKKIEELGDKIRQDIKTTLKGKKLPPF